MVRWVSLAECRIACPRPRSYVSSFLDRRFLFDGTFQPHLDQMQHAPINDPARYRFYKFGMRNAPEVVREVGINDFRMTPEH